MPFLRFSRDKRGYETTSLIHAVRRHGRARQRILYWFRTPPGVKVGRPALDEDAIRWIEEHNPGVQFDWQKILAAQPPSAPPTDDRKPRRARRERGERPKPAPPISPAVPQPVQPPPIQEEMESVAAEADVIELPPPDSELEEAEPEPPTLAPSPADQVLGSEQLVRLRARYAELQARITERGGDKARVDALRAQSEPLNPDSWVTEEDARKAVAEFEPRIREIRAALGLRRRRRSRRGGRRRRAGSPPVGQTANEAPASNAEAGPTASDEPKEST